MGRFAIEVLATADNRIALADLAGQWIDHFHAAAPPKCITLRMDSSVSPTHGAQEGTNWNRHFGCMCYRLLFVFNQLGVMPSSGQDGKPAVGNETIGKRLIVIFTYEIRARRG